MSKWRDSLRGARWRNIKFDVTSTEAVSGRRVQVHEYPFRNEPWAEDLGRRSRAFTIRGFLLGDDVAERLKAFQEAAEQAGPGELIHPFRPTVTATLIGLADHDTWEEGRVVRIVMEFVETGERRFPKAAIKGGAEISDAAALVEKAAAAVGAKDLVAVAQQGAGGVQQIARTAQSYVASARGLVNGTLSSIRSVASVLSAVPGLGKLSRFAGQGSSVIAASLGRITSVPAGASAVLGRITTARANIERLGDEVNDLAKRL